MIPLNTEALQVLNDQERLSGNEHVFPAYRGQRYYEGTEIPAEPPYPNAEVAIAGEDAMKARLQSEDCDSLGGEFFLAEENFVNLAWGAGLNAANKKKTDFEKTLLALSTISAANR